MVATRSIRIGRPDVAGRDRSGAGGFVRYVGRVCADEATRAYKEPTFALLEARPGQAMLDVGCGRGDDARTMAALVGQTGRVVGVDSDEVVLGEARRRSAGAAAPVDYRLGDAARLEFDDCTFDGCRAERLLSCVDEPERALAEMARVARPGARIVVSEPDWTRLLRDAPEPDLADRIVGRADRAWDSQLPALFRQCRLRDVTAMHVTVPLTALYLLAARLGLLELVEAALAEGAITSREAAQWLDSLEWAGRTGRSFGTLTALVVVGQKG
jgi:SAM-dependent methyltransferase